MMDLQTYLHTIGKTPAEFAREIDAPPQTVDRYIKRQRIPREPYMSRIVAKTNGQVTPNSFYSLAASQHPPPN